MNKQVKDFCYNFAGYDNEKKELLRILEWYKDKSIINNDDVNLVRGILFYGPAGNGKTTILKEYSKCFDCPIYNVSSIKFDDVDKLSKEITEMFKCARSEEFAIVLIDEIDHLFDLSPKILRLFQTELDGLSSNKNILVLAATNKNKSDFPPSLLRSGRFDRAIYIGYPSIKDREFLIVKFLSELNISINKINLNKVSKKMYRCSCIEIKSIINDAYLRNKDNINEISINDSYLRIIKGIIPIKTNKRIKKREAINFASKILLMLRNDELVDFKYVKVIGDDIIINTENKYEKEYETEYLFYKIDYYLSGICGEKLINRFHDVGNAYDISCAYDYVSTAIERNGLYGLNNILRHYIDKKERYETETKNRRINKIINKVLLQHYKSVYKFLKKNFDILIEIYEFLIHKNEFSIDDARNLGFIE